MFTNRFKLYSKINISIQIKKDERSKCIWSSNLFFPYLIALPIPETHVSDLGEYFSRVWSIIGGARLFSFFLSFFLWLCQVLVMACRI